MNLFRLICWRFLLGLVTLFVVSLIIFWAIELLPGDLAQEILGQSATPETVATFRRELGLDLPAWKRYLYWFLGAVQGDFGTSLANGNDISSLIAPRFLNTLFLAATAALISVPLALTLGVLAALYHDRWIDRLVNVLTLVSISSPEFFIGYILILLLAVMNPVFPAISNIDPLMSFGERILRTILPALTLTMVVTAHMMRMTRASIINLLSSPYIEMARLKGVRPFRVILAHALPNAWAPIINVVALNLGYLVTGVVVVEAVFIYPGVGKLLVDSVSKRDVPVVQACCLVFAATYIILNLTADVMSTITNPRLRHPK